jgi:aspartyl-tRNA(Asn)/glutamyl-tRNA(Gln) amidotransferase subunit A
MKFHEMTIKQIHEGLMKKEFSCEELTNSFLRWINERNPEINAFITVTDDLAMAQAKVIDEKIAAGEQLGDLAGVPCAIKDNILVEGVLATAGSKILSNYKATYNATVIERLKDAGAIFLGKTNCDEFAMGSSGETSYYGATKNPLDVEKVPGGSSAGSAAAVADNQCVFALGTDTGGSIRQPASLCGIVGLKPTYGRVSRHGAISLASSFDQIGPLTKNASDAALVMNVISGKDEFDANTVDKPEDFLAGLKGNLRGLKIGVPKEFFIKGMDANITKQVFQAINKLRDLGAEAVEVSLPYSKYALAVYYVLMPAEASSNLARYDGVHYGFQAKAGNLEDLYLQSRSIGFGDEVKRRIMLGTYVLSEGYSDEYYKKAQQVRALIKKDFDTAFEKVDCLVTPTSPSTAFDLGEKFDDPVTMYLADIFTVSVNVAGLPAISVPCGRVNELPVGLQIIGKHFDESLLLKVAHNFEINQD